MLDQTIDKLRELFNSEPKPIKVRATTHREKSFVSLPKDYKLVEIPQRGEIPTALNQSVSFDELDSFAGYLNRFGTPATVIFLEQTETTISMDAVLDYHRPLIDDDGEAYEPPPGTSILPQWCGHKASFRPVQTPEWKLWTTNNKRAKEQIDFARFLEENYPDIQEPVAADLIQICRNLELVGDVHYVKAYREQDGQTVLQYKEENRPNGQLVVPDHITLRIAPYRGEQSVEVVAKLRYRLAQGTCSFYYDLVRPEKVLDACATEMREQVVVLTNKRFPIYSGNAS